MELPLIFWKEITGFKGLYEISTDGRVRSLKTGKELKNRSSKNLYFKVALYAEGKRKDAYIHRLVAETFVPNPDELKYVNHKDGNIYNNSLFNLEWVTARGNQSHGYNSKDKTSKYTGVCWNVKANKWQASINIKGKTLYLGIYADELEAAKAYNTALEEMQLTNKYKNKI